MGFRHVLIVTYLFATAMPARADSPLDIVLSAEIISLKDNKTGERFVQPGHKVRVRSRVFLKVRGVSVQAMRDWLQDRLPIRVQGYFEREDKATDLVTRYKPVTFTLDGKTLKCQRDSTPEFRVCTAEYFLSRSNTVDFPAGEGGDHAVALEMLPPADTDFPIRTVRSAARAYSVLTGKPMLSLYQFAGLPEH